MGWSCPSVEIQSEYSTVPADWAISFINQIFCSSLWVRKCSWSRFSIPFCSWRSSEWSVPVSCWPLNNCMGSQVDTWIRNDEGFYQCPQLKYWKNFFLESWENRWSRCVKSLCTYIPQRITSNETVESRSSTLF